MNSRINHPTNQCSCIHCERAEQARQARLAAIIDLDNRRENLALSAGASPMEHLVRVPFGTHGFREIVSWLESNIGAGRVFAHCVRAAWSIDLAWEAVSETAEDRYIYVWFRSTEDQLAFILAWSAAEL